MLSQIKKKIYGDAVVSKFDDIGALIGDRVDSANDLPQFNKLRVHSDSKTVEEKKKSKVSKDAKIDKFEVENQENIPINLVAEKKSIMFPYKSSTAKSSFLTAEHKSTEVKCDDKDYWICDKEPWDSKITPAPSNRESFNGPDMPVIQTSDDDEWTEDFFAELHEQEEEYCCDFPSNGQNDETFAQFQSDIYPVEVVFSKVRHNRIEFVQEALENGFDAYGARDKNGNTMLHIAVSNLSI